VGKTRKVKSWFWSCHHNSIGLLGVWGLG